MAVTKTILLVEDDPNLADGLVINLEAEGYQVVHVSNGNLVIAEYEKGNFDLILMDVMLPGTDGLTLCKQIRKTGA
ncbi:MAG: response regulator, partial [bacterium]|nr:response regulator [bacterium]